ncbi:hypothetical protein LOC68_16660 [Blastopirellula sp. JC732]|uniref:Uncharacterized protein n=1 Tax=Blastopirellula sediminis TaxID=2894196 RepID=A0A9X1SGB4_9BACT|nr:hypothetical protein [Blastopirellula sediminis]MCC9606678.1 hypothetical protein [Blastopirellula sediminis]MCC9630025.1 hypothetical protein [Blastopirellula sediminis]
MRFRFTSSDLFRAIAIISILITVCFLSNSNREEEVPANDVARLFQGDGAIDLSHIEAFGQHRHLECHDPLVIQYLERCLAASTPGGYSLPTTEEEIRTHSGYYSYYVTFGLSNGRECTMFCKVSNRDLCLLVPEHAPAGEVGSPNHRAPFPQPMPEKLTELLAVLTTEGFPE